MFSNVIPNSFIFSFKDKLRKSLTFVHNNVNSIKLFSNWKQFNKKFESQSKEINFHSSDKQINIIKIEKKYKFMII